MSSSASEVSRGRRCDHPPKGGLEASQTRRLDGLSSAMVVFVEAAADEVARPRPQEEERSQDEPRLSSADEEEKSEDEPRLSSADEAAEPSTAVRRCFECGCEGDDLVPATLSSAGSSTCGWWLCSSCSRQTNEQTVADVAAPGYVETCGCDCCLDTEPDAVLHEDLLAFSNGGAPGFYQCSCRRCNVRSTSTTVGTARCRNMVAADMYLRVGGCCGDCLSHDLRGRKRTLCAGDILYSDRQEDGAFYYPSMEVYRMRICELTAHRLRHGLPLVPRWSGPVRIYFEPPTLNALSGDTGELSPATCSDCMLMPSTMLPNCYVCNRSACPIHLWTCLCGVWRCRQCLRDEEVFEAGHTHDWLPGRCRRCLRDKEVLDAGHTHNWLPGSWSEWLLLQWLPRVQREERLSYVSSEVSVEEVDAEADDAASVGLTEGVVEAEGDL